MKKNIKLKIVAMILTSLINLLVINNKSSAYYTSYCDAIAQMEINIEGHSHNLIEEQNDMWKGIKVKNTGDIPILVRVKIFTMQNKNVNIEGDNWKLGEDGAWYYQNQLEQDAITSELVIASSDNSEINVMVASESVIAWSYYGNDLSDDEWIPANICNSSNSKSTTKNLSKRDFKVLIGVGVPYARIKENDVSLGTFYSEADGTGGRYLGAELCTWNTENKWKVGKRYTEILKAENLKGEGSGTDAYIRARIYKYWLDEEGNKPKTFDYSLIELTGLGKNDWEEYEAVTTDERTELYYKKMVSSGTSTPPFLESFYLNPKIYKQTWLEKIVDGENTTLVKKYKYDGKKATIEVEVDTVQALQGTDAIMVSWGRKCEVNQDGTLTFLD